MSVLVLGLDPGLANCGYALVRLHESREEIIKLGVIRTKKSDVKLKMLSADDNFRRGKEVASALLSLSADVQVICAEAMSHVRNSSAAAKMATVWGHIEMLCVIYGLPLVQSSPQQIKEKVCGNRSASKEDIQQALMKRYPESRSLLDDLPESLYEHAYDALGSIVTGMTSETVLMARKFVKD